jgi:TRAP-type C4-dicarboxylate transport system substrate-binding protein
MSSVTCRPPAAIIGTFPAPPSLEIALRFAVAALLLAASAMGSAHVPAAEWAIANEYPATSLPGEGDAHFARKIEQRLHGKLAILPMPDGRLGWKSREQVRAVAEGKVAMANTLGGALAEEMPLLGLASLPFVAGDLAEARRLYVLARPAYEAAFAKMNQKLLYATPWPASGVWAKVPLDSAAALARLRIRTYDGMGTAVFGKLCLHAGVVSFADLPSKLASGEIDAVLSSGDGGAGRRLWEHLPHFTEIEYAVPLSFATVGMASFEALDGETRGAVLEIAADTEARQWRSLEGRVAENYARMKANGMTITRAIPAELRARLREAAREAVEDWARRAGPEAKALLERFRREGAR